MEIEITDEKWPKTLFNDDEPRAVGLHLGTVIKSLMDSTGMGYKGKGFNDMQLTAEIGLLWEDVLSKIMRDKYAARPGQIQRDGIWMSPDGVGADPDGEVHMVLEEYKATWKSIKRSPADDFYYMAQVKSYCRAIETTVAVMRIFYIMGDYRGSGPMYRVARLTFTQYELDKNWEMIVKHKEGMKEDMYLTKPGRI